VQIITQWHKARGFTSIGYHFVICPDGSLQIGRPLDEVGAHAQGYNQDSIGVCMCGLDRFSDAQFTTLNALLQDLKMSFPRSTLHGHREFSKEGKTCPNFDYSQMKELYESNT
jgi:N-acetylmuramoyl-L-alanine amidase